MSAGPHEHDGTGRPTAGTAGRPVGADGPYGAVGADDTAVAEPDPRTDLPASPTTGDEQVDAALRTLRQELDRGDPGAAADALAAAHRSLQARLTSPEIDEPGSPGARPRPR